MAKLKCLQVVDGAKVIWPDGYINIANKLVESNTNFDSILLNNADVPGILNRWAGVTGGNGKTIEHLKSNGDPEPINSGNCTIVVKQDKYKDGTNSKAHIGLPPIRPVPKPGSTDHFGYLGDYANIIHQYYVTNTDDSKAKAHSFMFGIMLLTRCR